MRKREDLPGLLIIEALIGLLSIPTVIPVFYQVLIDGAFLAFGTVLAIFLLKERKYLLGLFIPTSGILQFFHNFFVADLAIAMVLFISALAVSKSSDEA